MQRAPVSSLLLSPLLYFAVCALANQAALAQQQDSRTAEQLSRPHIAVLLPLKSAAIGRQAEALRLGILEAAKVHRGTTLPLVVRGTGDDPFDVVQDYESAVRAGAQLVIGPLTRSAVTALAGTTLVIVPTLALNAPEDESVIPPKLYVFGLQVENEARQVAQLARDRGRRNAIVVSSEAPLSHRLAQAFEDEFARRGGTIQDQFQYSSAPGLVKLRETIATGVSDVIFLALDAERAKLVRSYLGTALPIYATSMVHTSAEPLANFELNGIYFVDMPWLLSPDHPAVLSYTRQDQLGLEFQRFYALGIDAYRIAQELLMPASNQAPLDGVTGYITLEKDHRYVREVIPAQFSQGETHVLSRPLSWLLPMVEVRFR
jgi:outer membrane PBP1 activator LpoA protein